MKKIFNILVFAILQVSCHSETKESKIKSEDTNQGETPKLITIAVKVKPQKGAILNIANQFYDNLELRFFNDSSAEKTILKTLSITKTKLITHFGVYMPNPNTTFTFQHAFLLTKEYDTIHLDVTDSLDIAFSDKNKKNIRFIDDYTNDLASMKNIKSIIEIDKKKEKSLLKLSNSNLPSNDKKNIECYIEQTYLYSILRFKKLKKSTQVLEESSITLVEKFLSKYDSILSPNLQLLEIFNILKNEKRNTASPPIESCNKFNYMYDFKNIFKNYVAQAFILFDLKSTPTKNDSCWNRASSEFRTMLFYQKNKEKVDSVLFKRANNISKESLSNLKLIDENRLAIDLNKILVANNKKIYLIDFWATWCIPCVKENQILKLKIKNISNQVGIIKISLDDDKNFELWKTKIIKGEMNYKAVGGFENEFCKKFKINEIPRYMLVNSNGEILNQDFNRPSDSLFVSYLNAYSK